MTGLGEARDEDQAMADLGASMNPMAAGIGILKPAQRWRAVDELLNKFILTGRPEIRSAAENMVTQYPRTASELSAIADVPAKSLGDMAGGAFVNPKIFPQEHEQLREVIEQLYGVRPNARGNIIAIDEAAGIPQAVAHEFRHHGRSTLMGPERFNKAYSHTPGWKNKSLEWAAEGKGNFDPATAVDSRAFMSAVEPESVHPLNRMLMGIMGRPDLASDIQPLALAMDYVKAQPRNISSIPPRWKDIAAKALAKTELGTQVDDIDMLEYIFNMARDAAAKKVRR